MNEHNYRLQINCLANFGLTSFEQKEARTANTGFASGGVTCKLGALCFYSSSVQVDSFVLRNPPERKARKRSGEIPSGSRQIALEALPSEALSGTSHIRRFCKMQNTSQSLQCVMCNAT